MKKYIVFLLLLLLGYSIAIAGQSIACDNNQIASSLYYRSPLDQVIKVSGITDDLFFPFNKVGANQAPPDEPFSISLAATGPYRAPANIELLANITHPANTTISRIEFYNGEEFIQAIAEPPYQITLDAPAPDHYPITAKLFDSSNVEQATASIDVEVIPSNWYNRGSSADRRFTSSIIAIDRQRGISLDGIEDYTELYQYFP